MTMRLRPTRRNGRRAGAALLLAAAVTAAGLVTPAVAAAGGGERHAKLAGMLKPDHRDRAHDRAHGHRAEHEAQAEIATVPAPPAPPKLRPDQRVVGGTQALARPAAEVKVQTAAFTSGGALVAAPAAPAPISKSGAAAPGGGTGRTLVLYDNSGPWGWLGEVYGTQTANLVSHFGPWTARPVGQYQPGELNGYAAVVYVGSTYDEPLPVAFLDDVYATTKPVLWMYSNIWQLTARRPDFATKYGFTWKQFDVSAVAEVRYRGTSLTRSTLNGAGIMDHVISDPAKASVVGQAVRADGTTFPWAVRSGNLTYLGEIPFSYVTHEDRYIAFSDMLFDLLAPATPTRHRALVRIEDVGPDADPAELKATADYLFSKKVPFSVAVYPRYRDPKGVNNNRKPEDYVMSKRPQVVAALKYMEARGGTLIMHGYTHQYSNVNNPYDGVSANDFEFYRAHVDANDSVIYDGPVAEDSQVWAAARMNMAFSEFSKSGLKKPTIFEFPHYAGSVADYQAAQSLFGRRYDRALYYPGVLKGGAIDDARRSGQFFPYSVRDVYGSAVVPENIGNVEPEAFNNHPARLPADLVDSARRNLVVRDGTASFFYHPYLGTAYLKQVVEGVQGLGYTFVTAQSTIP